MRRIALAICALLLSAVPAAAQSTCTFPWGPDYDPSATFVVGGLYRSPYSEVIEILAKVCRLRVDGECVYETFAVRNRQGRAIRSTVPKTVVFRHETGELRYAEGEFPAVWPIGEGKWAPLPGACGFAPTPVVSVHEGTLTLRVP